MEGVIILYLFLCFLLHPSESKLSSDREELINQTIEAGTTALNSSSLLLRPYHLDIEELVGNHIEPEITHKSLFYLYRHFYHINIPGNSDWLEGYRYNVMIDKNFRHIRRVHDKIQDVRDLIEDCKAALDEAKRTELTLPTNETINWCIDKGNESLAYITSEQYKLDVKLAQLDALNIVIYTFFMSFRYKFHNQKQVTHDKFGYNYLVYLSPFWKMWNELRMLDGLIPELIAILEERRDIDDPPGYLFYFHALNNVVHLKLESEEYRYHHSKYDNIAEDIVFLRYDELEILEEKVAEEFTRSTNWAKSYHLWRSDYSKFSEAEFFEFKKKATTLFDKNFRVELLNPDDPPHLYRWKRNNENTVIFNMTLAWDKMDEIYEELVCYAGVTYDEFRNDTLKQAQGDIKKGILFAGISYTLGQPCVTHPYIQVIEKPFVQYYELMSPYCTSENNEICAPRSLSQFEDPDNPLKGGMSILKPKWVFTTKPPRSTEGKCVGHRTWVIQQKACRCGFRTDCGDDLNVSISCPFQPNDWEVRRQCRGSVGYPCSSLPMAPGKHHESCVTGYCDMRGNSCEDGPMYQEEYSGAVGLPFGIFTFTQIISGMFLVAIES